MFLSGKFVTLSVEAEAEAFRCMHTQSSLLPTGGDAPGDPDAVLTTWAVYTASGRGQEPEDPVEC